jgi:hypothetical protein
MARRKRPSRDARSAARERAKAAERFLVRLIWILASEGTEAARAALREAGRARGPKGRVPGRRR